MYKAIVARVSVRPHPNADKLQIGNVLGNQVVVGINTPDGSLGVYFEADGQLSVEFAERNNLIRVTLPDGTKTGGMFDENRRVRAQNLRGVKSNGFWCELSYLLSAGVSEKTIHSLKEGDTFDTLDGIAICNKYYTPETLKAQANKVVIKNNKVISFPEHIETEQYRYVKDKITDGFIVITEKLHGTSGRFSNAKVQRTLTWKDKIAKFFGIPVQEHEYKYVIGTRRTILQDNSTGFYGNEQFRRDAVKNITLKPDEIIYFELVGYTTENKLIMSAQDTSKLDKNMMKVYGKEMKYTYGTQPGECTLFVYRITQSGAELSHFQMVQRCKELGLRIVPVLHTMMFADTESLDMIVDNLMTGPSTLDQTHIREGVVIRVENEHGTRFIKSKSWEFGVLEGYIKSNDDYVDTEEIA